MDLVFHALAHAARRKILDLVRHSPGCTVGKVCSAFECSRIAVLKHLRILEEAQLLLVRKDGRRRILYFNVVPIQLIYDRWTDDFSGFWATQAVDLKRAVEARFAATLTTSNFKPQPERALTKRKGSHE